MDSVYVFLILLISSSYYILFSFYLQSQEYFSVTESRSHDFLWFSFNKWLREVGRERRVLVPGLLSNKNEIKEITLTADVLLL